MFDDFKCYLCEKLFKSQYAASYMSVCHELLEELIETIVNQDCEHENYFKCYLCEKLFKSQYTGSYECVSRHSGAMF